MINLLSSGSGFSVLVSHLRTIFLPIHTGEVGAGPKKSRWVNRGMFNSLPKLSMVQRGLEQEVRGREGLKFTEQEAFLTRRNNLGGMGAEDSSGTKKTMLPCLAI